jgi:Sel1 repeat/SPOR domain
MPAAADYQAGLDAYNAGHYATAFQQWQAVAAGTRQDETPAIYAETHYAIAMLYWQGQGVPQDYQQAYDWLLKAAGMNHAGAQAKLGYLFSDGSVVPQDLHRAFEYYEKAARQGDVDGQYNLGVFYLNGWGTEQDTIMAKQYLAAASAQGDKAAEQALQRLLVDEIASAETRDSTILYESWILAQNPNHYTLQVIALSSREKVEALIQGYDRLAPFAIYTPMGNSRPLYILLQGSYAQLDAARTARDTFPRAIQKPDQLWIRQFGKVQELVKE